LPIETQKIFIDGPTGKLEAVLAIPESESKGIAVIAHPHPLHGGTMDNKIVHTVFTTLQSLNFVTVKFNFRGVGASAGIFDHGIGEVGDVIAVTEAIRSQFDQREKQLPLLLAGFSFGGGIQLFAAAKLNPMFLILVAPSVAHLKAPPVPDSVQFALIVQGDQDDIVLPQQVLAWATPKSQPIVLVPGADHFFHGKLLLLRQWITRFLAS